MNDREKFYKSITNEDGIFWPEDSDSRQLQSEELFGATVMGVLDTIVKNRLTNDDSRNKLIKETAASTLYWLFTKLDQFPGASLKVILEEHESKDGAPSYIGQPNDDELRLKFFDWLERYSEYVSEVDI